MRVFLNFPIPLTSLTERKSSANGDDYKRLQQKITPKNGGTKPDYETYPDETKAMAKE